MLDYEYVIIFYVYKLYKSTGTLEPFLMHISPIIDGKLNEIVWKNATSFTGLKIWMPDYGMDMHGETGVLMASDNRNLYFAFRFYDSETNKIKSSITSRDNIINNYHL